MVVLLVATSGMFVYRLHCSCMQKEYVSVFIEPESCHPAGHSHCCSSSPQCSCGDHQNEYQSSGCDTHEAFFVRLTSVFISENPTTVISPTQTIIFNTLFSDLLFPELNNDEGSISGGIINSPPPRIISGQKIITLFHQFKFDQHFSIA